MAATQIKKVRNWHEALVDFEIMNPTATLAELAEFFDKSVSWLSIVKNSAAYKEYRMQRIGEHQTMVSASTTQKLEALAEVTTDLMLQKVQEEREKLTIADLGGMCSLALKSLGYGNGAQAPSVQNNVQNNYYTTPSKQALEAAREKAKEVHEFNTSKLLPSPTPDAA